MIAISIAYLYREGATFDLAYYENYHMPMVKERLGDACTGYAIYRGLPSGEGSPAAAMTTGVLFCTSIEAFAEARERHASEISSDIPKFTNVAPVIQISEVIAERRDKAAGSNDA